MMFHVFSPRNFADDLALVKTQDYIVGVDVDELIKEKEIKQFAITRALSCVTCLILILKWA